MAKSKLTQPTKADVILKRLGERILQLRKKAGKSQTQFSYEMGWDKPNLRKIEKGKTNPTVKTLIKISDVLGISISKLLDLDNYI
jgi:transcriptional regulator with XRE-family HTH domain